MTVAALFLMSGATASAFALAWRITTAPPVDVPATRAQLAQAPAPAAPTAAPKQEVSSRRARRPSPPAWAQEDAASPLAGAAPAIPLRALGSPTHAPDELWARAVRLASAGVDLVLTESSLAHHVVSELQHDLGPSAKIVQSEELPGIRVASLAPGSIVGAAGLQQGDVVTAVNGHPLTSPDDMLNAYASAVAAQQAVIELRRGPRAVVLRLRLRT